MHRLKSMNETRNEEFCDQFVEFSSPGDVVSEVPTKEKVHYQVKVGFVLKRKVHIHDELRLDALQMVQFFHHTRD